MRRGPTHRSGTHRIDLRLGPDARALVEAVRAADAPSTEDRARVRRALFAALAASAATTASAATASAATASAASSASAGALSSTATAASALTSSGAAATVAPASAAAASAVPVASGAALGITSTGAALTKFAAIAVASAALATAIAVGPSALTRSLEQASSTEAEAAPFAAPAVLHPPRHRASELPLARTGAATAPSALEAEASAQPELVAVEPSLAAPASEAPQLTAVAAAPRRARATSARPEPEASLGHASVEAEPRTPAAPAASLADETAVLRAAWREIRFGDAASALARLDAHRARFPSGVLVPERDAARVIALCVDGQVAEGRRAATQFAAEHASSPLTARVRAACE